MRLKIYDGAEVEKEEELYLRLAVDGTGVMLVAVNKDGNNVGRGNILSVSSGGVIRLHSYVNAEIGLQITKSGHVKVVKN